MATLAVLWSICAASAVDDARDYAVLVSAEVQAQPPQITLNWPQDTFALPASYTVSRKAPAATSWTLLSVLPGTATSFVDTNVALNAAYEYQVEKSATGYAGYGYVLAGIESALAEFRGTVVLIVDSTYAMELAAELARLEQDLAGDGWQVIRHDVNRTDSPVSVKDLIKADYATSPGEVQSVFLFGHVPVPYSGDIVPDGHSPDHRGAWPADVFYGEMDGDWTDTTVNDTAASDPRNVNVPQDGKFDQSYIPGAVELEVGRVDLANLPSFALPEQELLRQYLNKDHDFRHKRVTAQRRGLVYDNFGVSAGSAYAATGWRNFAACFGASNVVVSGSWFGGLANDSFLCAYGCGAGTYTSIAGIGCTGDFALNDPQAVFTFLFGSYLGDWDSTDNVMRAALATPQHTLTSAWAGRPHWFAHHMALGQTAGYSTRLSQNNNSSSPYKPLNTGWQKVHIALMGDPTLRLHPVAPPSSVIASVDASRASLAWAPSAEPVLGYFVYRATKASGPFTRITSELVTDCSFTDSGVGAGTYTYMVRAVKLESSGSGTYYNASQGAFTTATFAATPITVTTAPDLRVELGTAWSFTPPIAIGGQGEVSILPLATITNFSCGICPVITRVWQATDTAGNTCLATNTVTVADTTPPTLDAPADKTVNLGTPWTFATPVATDISGSVIITVLSTVTNAGVGGVFAATRTWEARDACGNASACSQTVTVQNTGPAILSISAPDAVASELRLNTGTLVISRTGDLSRSLAVKLGYSGTARNGVDYLPLPATATIPAGATSISLLVTPIPDKLYEQTEAVTVTIQSSSAYILGAASKATVTIQDAPPPTVNITAMDNQASEAGSDTGMYLISRTGDTFMPLTVNLSIGGTARNGTDYLALPTRITIPAGANSISLPLTPKADNLNEKSETVEVTVGSSNVYLVGSASKATVTIANTPN